MKLYHIDNYASLSGPITLGKMDSLSSHGAYYWKEKPFTDMKSVMNSITEHFFEAVRVKEFPKMPSRFLSMFACFPEDLPPWVSFFERQGFPVDHVWEVDAHEAVRLDASLLKSFWDYPDGVWFDPAFATVCARAYWGQSSIDTLRDDRSPQPCPWIEGPFFECLLPLPVRVLRLLSPAELAALLGRALPALPPV